MHLENRLAGTVVLITGGGSGLGKRAAEGIPTEGAVVARADARPVRAEEATDAIGTDGASMIAGSGDLAT